MSPYLRTVSDLHPPLQLWLLYSYTLRASLFHVTSCSCFLPPLCMDHPWHSRLGTPGLTFSTEWGSCWTASEETILNRDGSRQGQRKWGKHSIIHFLKEKQRHYFANKVLLVKAMVFPVVMYRCQSWTIKKAERQRIGAFELWCWRRLLRVPWVQGDPTSPS